MSHQGRGYNQERRGRGQPYGQPYGRNRGQKFHRFQDKSEKKSDQNVDRESDKNVKKKEETKKVTIYMPRLSPVESNPEETLLICYDTENTFGNDLGEIFQIGAILNGEDKFSVTILPQGNIHWGVVKYAGINVEVKYSAGRKYLQHR